MKLFTLYIGCANAFETVLGIIYPRFESFTFLRGEGVFRGEREPVLLVKIATEDVPAVINAAEAIRAQLGQTGVGIEYGGRYYRCRENEPALDLHQALLTGERRVA